jgi:hypothetical protein
MALRDATTGHVKHDLAISQPDMMTLINTAATVMWVRAGGKEKARFELEGVQKGMSERTVPMLRKQLGNIEKMGEFRSDKTKDDLVGAEKEVPAST